MPLFPPLPYFCISIPAAAACGGAALQPCCYCEAFLAPSRLYAVGLLVHSALWPWVASPFPILPLSPIQLPVRILRILAVASAPLCEV